MRPILFEVFGVAIPSYFTLLTGGFLLCLLLAYRDAPRLGLDPEDVLDLGLWVLLAGLFGARLLHVVADGFFMDYVHLCTDPLQVDVPSFIHVPCAVDGDCVAAQAGALCDPAAGRCHPARDCFAWLKFWQGGLAFFGGLLAALAVGLRFMARRGMARARVLDLGGFAVPLALGVGRVGCFLAGCCFGQPTAGPFGVVFDGAVRALGPNATCPPGWDRVATVAGDAICAVGRPAVLEQAEQGLLHAGAHGSLPVHPTQLYEAALALALFVGVYALRRRLVGRAFWVFAAGYGAGRFAIELLRADDRGLWLGGALSTSQLIAVPVVAYALYRLARPAADVPPVKGP
ncbi:MAG: prolipoprotein diacylglyceryl transferase [Myxococcales bacterium]|nr:prolipoprotein diacylglyceryl transferase [Myxococcales bacterium]